MFKQLYLSVFLSQATWPPWSCNNEEIYTSIYLIHCCPQCSPGDGWCPSGPEAPKFMSCTQQLAACMYAGCPSAESQCCWLGCPKDAPSLCTKFRNGRSWWVSGRRILYLHQPECCDNIFFPGSGRSKCGCTILVNLSPAFRNTLPIVLIRSKLIILIKP